MAARDQREEDQRVAAQCRVLTGLKLPTFNWKASNMKLEFDIFEQSLEIVLSGMDIPREKWYLYILQQFDREGIERWNKGIKNTVDERDPTAVLKAFRRAYEVSETYWTYRSLYLSSAKQGHAETAAALATRIEELVALCEWPENQRQQRRIDLFYYLTEHFDVQRFIQLETAKEGVTHTWDMVVEEAKRQERIGKEYARFRRENGGSSTPS